MKKIAVDELLDTYMDECVVNFNTEGEDGVDSLQDLFTVLNSQYESIGDFLSDNPGAQEAILDWIRKQIPKDKEWQKALRDEIESNSP